MLRIAGMFVVLLACTKTSETAHPTPVVTVTPPDAAAMITPVDAAAMITPADASVPLDAAAIAVAPNTPAVLASCPKTFVLAAAGTCALASVDKLDCKYPDGHCSCFTATPCAGWGGAYEEAHNHPRARWDCTPKVRADGCPGDSPKIGSSCRTNGKECAYGSCGGEVLACRSGAWALDRQIAPPP